MAFGRGKVILLGEHGVVHGRPALAAGIARGVEAHARLGARDELEIDPWTMTVRPGDDGDLPRALAAALGLYATRSPVHVQARVDLPAGAGLGCSAALGVAVIGAVDEAFGIERAPAELAEASLAWERVFHGNPSGVDSAMAALGGVALFRRGEPLEPIAPRTPLRLVVADSGEPSSTKRMVEDVARQRARTPARVDKVFDGIAAIVQNGRLAIEAGDLRALGQLMTLDQALLASIMVSTAKLEEMCAAATEAGALGAKLTGAGGGGCMIALVDSDEAARAVIEALTPLAALCFEAEAGT
jgi:mevalonate kinase